MTTKYHIFVIILVFPKENQIVFGRYGVVEFVKKNWGIDWWLIQKFLNNIALGSIKKCWLSQRFGEKGDKMLLFVV